MDTILEECRRLVGEGVKELVLLGQNVNSYRAKSADALQARPETSYSTSSPGFNNIYRLRGGGGYFFANLVAAVYRSRSSAAGRNVFLLDETEICRSIA